MKTRRGFVSNSSSASFILAFPKDNPVELKNIEDWFGGFSNTLSSEDRDMFSFILWRSQYFDSEMYRRDWTGTGEEYNHHICTAPYKSRIDREVFECPGCLDYDTLDLNQVCKSCKYHSVEKRYERGDDFYYAKDSVDKENFDWLEAHKEDKIVYLEIDDNNPASGIPFDTACEITSKAYDLFNSTNKNVLVCGGK